MHAIAVMIVFALPSLHGYRQRANVERVELNHLLNSNDEVQFSQVILWRWTSTIDGYRYVVAEWFIVRNCEHVMLDRFGDHHRLTWRDKYGRMYEAITPAFRETWTRSDPEMDDRKLFPTKFRRAYFLR